MGQSFSKFWPSVFHFPGFYHKQPEVRIFRRTVVSLSFINLVFAGIMLINGYNKLGTAYLAAIFLQVVSYFLVASGHDRQARFFATVLPYFFVFLLTFFTTGPIGHFGDLLFYTSLIYGVASILFFNIVEENVTLLVILILIFASIILFDLVLVPFKSAGMSAFEISTALPHYILWGFTIVAFFILRDGYQSLEEDLIRNHNSLKNKSKEIVLQNEEIIAQNRTLRKIQRQIIEQKLKNDQQNRLLEETKNKLLKSVQHLEKAKLAHEISEKKLGQVLDAIKKYFIVLEIGVNGRVLRINELLQKSLGLNKKHLSLMYFDDLTEAGSGAFEDQKWTFLHEKIKKEGGLEIDLHLHGLKKAWIYGIFIPVINDEMAVAKYMYLGYDISPMGSDKRTPKKQAEENKNQVDNKVLAEENGTNIKPSICTLNGLVNLLQYTSLSRDEREILNYLLLISRQLMETIETEKAVSEDLKPVLNKFKK